MFLDDLREFCLSRKGATEHFPFDQNTLVFKVGNKMFALMDVEHFEGIALKCDPEYAQGLRAEYSAISGAFHMSKVHWNSVKVGGDVDDQLLRQLIQDSYNLVFDKLTKKIKNEIEMG